MHGLLHDCGLLRFGGWIDSRCAGGAAAARCRKDESRTTEQTMNRLVRHGDLLPDPLSRSRARRNSGAPSSTSPRKVQRAGDLRGWAPAQARGRPQRMTWLTVAHGLHDRWVLESMPDGHGYYA